MHARRTSDGQTEVSALSVIRDQIEREIARVERDGSSEQDVAGKKKVRTENSMLGVRCETGWTGETDVPQ